jgi:cytochrome bd-type quinol oxidase subunit 1
LSGGAAMDLDPIFLARAQFAFIIAFHIFFLR